MRNRANFMDVLIISSIYAILTSLRIVFGIFFVSENQEEGILFPGMRVKYSIFLYIICIIIFIMYGYLLRRRFIKTQEDREEKVLLYPFKTILPIFVLVIIYTLIIQSTFLRLNRLLVDISNSAFEILQLTTLSFMVGIIGYTYLEKYLGPIIFKEQLDEDKQRLGIGLFESQTSDVISKYWRNGLLLIGVIVSLANLIVFLIYPSIPADSSFSTISIALPNFLYRYDPSDGFRQEIFSLLEFPSSYFYDWKLFQSILCLVIFGFTILFIYLPTKRSVQEHNKSEEVKRAEETQEDIAYNILSPSIKDDSYLPSVSIKEKPRSRMRKLIDKTITSDFIPIMGLLSLNIALALFMIQILTNLGIPVSSSLQIDSDIGENYIYVSQLYWAGFNEEITFRLLLFGLPLFIIYGVFFLFIVISKYLLSRTGKENKNRSKITLKILDSSPTNPLLYLTGRWKKIRFLDIVFLLLSSFAFGFVHYQISYPYWDVGKIIQAGIAGVIFGYAHIKYGFHAAIFIHASNNFIVGLVLTLNLGLILLEEILLLLMLVFGTLYIIYYFGKFLALIFQYLAKLLGRTSLIATNKNTIEK